MPTPTLDWLEGTWIGTGTAAGLDAAEALAGPKTEIQRGSRGYSHSAIVAQTGRVSWSPDRPTQGVHLTLPAGALASTPAADANKLLQQAHATGMKATRIDLALDDRTGLLDMDTIQRHLVNSWFVGRAQRGLNIDGWLRSDEDGGRTLNVGSRRSTQYMRIYDKAAEQHLPRTHWNRVELEIKHERAEKALPELATRGPANVVGWIRNYIDFTEPEDDTNRRRWTPAPWWDQFLSDIDKERILIAPPDRTLQTMMQWFEKTVAPTLYVLMQHRSPEWIIGTIEEAGQRLTPRNKTLLPANITQTIDISRTR